MKHSYGLRRMIRSYLPLFVIVIALLLLIFMLAVNQVVQRENERANANYAGYIMQTLDNQVQVLEQTFLRDVFFHEDVQKFYNPLYIGDAEVSYQLSLLLQEFVRSNILVDSVYLYRESDQRVLSNTIMIDVKRYGDAGFIRKAPLLQQDGQWGQARVFDETNQSGTHVVSATRTYKRGKEVVGLLVVNMSVHRLQQLYDKLGDVSFSTIAIKDTDGQWLTGDREGMTRTDADVTLQSAVTGWTISSSLNARTWLGSIQLISDTWLVAMALIVILGLGWLLYMIRRNYRPIEALTARLEQFSLKKSNTFQGEGDEFDFIENAFNELLEQSQSYSRKLHAAHVYRDNALFQELVCGTNLSGAEVESILEARGMQGRGYFCLIQVEIDRYREFEEAYNSRDQHLLKFSLKTVIREMGEKHGYQVWAEWMGDNRAAMLIQAKESQVRREPDDFAKELLIWVEQHLKFSITLAKSDWQQGYEQLYLAYETAGEWLDMKASLGGNRLIGATDVNQGEVIGYYVLIPDVHEMTDAFKLGKADWKKGYAVLQARIRLHAMNRRELVQLFEYMLHKLNSEISDAMPDAQDYWGESDLSELKTIIRDFDTIEDLFSQVGVVLSAVFARMMAWREANGKHALLERAKHYVEQTYQDSELSLQQVSDRFGLSQAQFSQLFKRGVGEKFVDYVTRLRIEQAKIRLATSQEAIQEIAQEVGYVHAVSFNRSFKKLTGQTPGDYRRAHSKLIAEGE